MPISMLNAFKGMKIEAPDNSSVNKSKITGPMGATIKSWKDRVIDDYYKNGVDLNKGIARIAETNNLTNEQISRIVEEANCDIYELEYAKKKNESVRDIEFGVASLVKVKDILSGDAEANQEPVRDAENNPSDKAPTMMKKASCVDTVDFMNETTGSSPAMSMHTDLTERSILEKKAEALINNLNSEIKKTASDWERKVGVIGDALIQYAHFNKDINSIFQKVANESGLSKKYQLPIIKMAGSIVENGKRVGRVPASFNAHIDTSQYKVAMSLGDFSLIDQAEDKPHDEILPVVISGKEVMTGYGSLVKMATKLIDDQDKLQTLESRKADLVAKVPSLS